MLELLFLFVESLFHLCQLFVTVLYIRELTLDLVTLGNQFCHRLHMIFLFEVIERVESAINPVQFCGIKIYAFKLAADLGREILHLDIAAIQPFYQLRDGRIDLLHTFQS